MEFFHILAVTLCYIVGIHAQRYTDRPDSSHYPETHPQRYSSPPGYHHYEPHRQQHYEPRRQYHYVPPPPRYIHAPLPRYIHVPPPQVHHIRLPAINQRPAVRHRTTRYPQRTNPHRPRTTPRPQVTTPRPPVARPRTRTAVRQLILPQLRGRQTAAVIQTIPAQQGGFGLTLSQFGNEVELDDLLENRRNLLSFLRGGRIVLDD